MESDSWSDAIAPENTPTQKVKQSIKQTRLQILLKFLKIYKKVLSPDIYIIEDYKFHHEFNLMRTIEKNPPLEQFKIMRKYNICGRIVIFLPTKEEPKYFIQSLTLKQIENKTLKGKGNVFSIDTLGNIYDLTYQYSTKMQHHNLFKKVCETIAKKNKVREDICWREFDKLDDSLLKRFGNNKNVFKNHPLYALNSLMPKNKIIFSSEFCGTFKGEKVFFRKDVRKVYKESELGSIGMKPKGDIFALQVDGEKAYLMEHLCALENNANLHDFDKKYINNDHEIPKDACFRGYPSFKICSILCIFHKEVVYKRQYGVLIRKSDAELFDRGLSEYQSLASINKMAFETLNAVKSWNKLKKYVSTYEKIRKRINDDQ